jgi:toxin secretion/phage lysis holin
MQGLVDLSNFRHVAMVSSLLILMMIFDILTGILKSIIKKDVGSQKLKIGLIIKIGQLITIPCMIVLKYIIPFFTEEMIIGILSLMIFSEFVSIIENLKIMGVNVSFFDKIIKNGGINNE